MVVLYRYRSALVRITLGHPKAFAVNYIKHLQAPPGDQDGDPLGDVLSRTGLLPTPLDFPFAESLLKLLSSNIPLSQEYYEHLTKKDEMYSDLHTKKHQEMIVSPIPPSFFSYCHPPSTPPLFYPFHPFHLYPSLQFINSPTGLSQATMGSDSKGALYPVVFASGAVARAFLWVLSVEKMRVEHVKEKELWGVLQVEREKYLSDKRWWYAAKENKMSLAALKDSNSYVIRGGSAFYDAPQSREELLALLFSSAPSFDYLLSTLFAARRRVNS
jgi:hypothetical protein